MASFKTAIVLFFLVSLIGSSSAQLTTGFYSKSCPKLYETVKSVVHSAIQKETRMGASLLRLFFHDCFVNARNVNYRALYMTTKVKVFSVAKCPRIDRDIVCKHLEGLGLDNIDELGVEGCDGSLFLDDTSTFTGEKRAQPNFNSARGFEVIDDIKSAVEKVCPGVVSCADILAVTARDSVVILGGPHWDVKLGRRDARTASQAAANSSIPPPTSNLNRLISSFTAVGLSTKDMVALSGAHTIGQARCTSFRARIYNETNNLDSSLAKTRQNNCPRNSGSGDNNLAPLDLQTPTYFDNHYFINLVSKKGLLHSDQQLFNGGSADSIVKSYSDKPNSFATDFVTAMIKMGDILPLTGSKGEIRKNCRRIN